MKKMRLFLLLFAAAIASASFTACSDDDDNAGSSSSSSIVGSWKDTSSDDTGSLILVFKSDQTGTLTLKGSESSLTENFEYKYSESEQILTILGSMLSGRYETVLAATKLRLYIQGGTSYYEFVRQ